MWICALLTLHFNYGRPDVTKVTPFSILPMTLSLWRTIVKFGCLFYAFPCMVLEMESKTHKNSFPQISFHHQVFLNIDKISLSILFPLEYLLIFLTLQVSRLVTF